MCYCCGYCCCYCCCCYVSSLQLLLCKCVMMSVIYFITDFGLVQQKQVKYHHVTKFPSHGTDHKKS